jgi:beta-lactam-binding protein with PASTA domain
VVSKHASYLAGQVVTQHPNPGAIVPEGTKVKLTVSLGPAGL